MLKSGFNSQLSLKMAYCRHAPILIWTGVKTAEDGGAWAVRLPARVPGCSALPTWLMGIGKIKIACDHGRKADKDQGRALLHLKSRFIIRHLSLSFVSKATTSAARAITVCNRRRVCSQSLIIGLPLTAAAGAACLCLSLRLSATIFTPPHSLE